MENIIGELKCERYKMAQQTIDTNRNLNFMIENQVASQKVIRISNLDCNLQS